ncbi:MAG: peptide chain release factor N(5)-glutamine methyltransferase [Chitinophagales bacterium]|nr:peptide chain release factor N(5)-glutamine methyltransferase [Bacteroidota bacterium]
MNVRTVKQLFKENLGVFYTPNELSQITYWVLEECLQTDRIDLMLNPLQNLTDKQQKKIEKIMSQLAKHQPIQYILGKAEFMDLELRVNKSVLIPRPETEDLVHWITEIYWQQAQNPLRILDIGTGSGCIALALKNAFPQAEVWASDIDEKALTVAEKNAQKNKLSVSFVQNDITQKENWLRDQTWDIMVSNPPYIPYAEQFLMSANTAFEPEKALFVPDADPLLFYRTIAEFALKNLSPEGKLFFELNENYAQTTQALLQKMGFREVVLHKDLQEKYRMLVASLHQ